MPALSGTLTTAVQRVEMCQRRAARFVKGNYSRYASVTTMLDSLQWPSLTERRRNAKQSCQRQLWPTTTNVCQRLHSWWDQIHPAPVSHWDPQEQLLPANYQAVECPTRTTVQLHRLLQNISRYQIGFELDQLHPGLTITWDYCRQISSEDQGAVSIRSSAIKNLLKPKFKQESVTFMPTNKEVKINNTKPFPVNWT